MRIVLTGASGLLGRAFYRELTMANHSVIGGAIDDWAVRFPTWVDDVACFLRHWTAALEQGEALSGIWHVSGLEAMSKFGMCQRIAAVLGLNAKGVEPCSEPGGGAPRPRNSQLDCARARARGWMVSTPFEEAVREVDASMPER